MLSGKEEYSCAPFYILKQVEIFYILSDDVRDQCFRRDFHQFISENFVLLQEVGFHNLVLSQGFTIIFSFIKWHAKLCCMYSEC